MIVERVMITFTRKEGEDTVRVFTEKEALQNLFFAKFSTNFETGERFELRYIHFTHEGIYVVYDQK